MKLIKLLANNAPRCLVAIILTFGVVHSARAFTAANADTLFNDYNTAFYVGNNGNAYYSVYKGTGTSGIDFWETAEEIEAAEDAALQDSSYDSLVTALINGFSANMQTNWSYDTYNDDICWGCLAYLRGYEITGNSTFLQIAQANYGMMYARAWDSSAGGLWWNTSDNAKNSCVECPGSIVAYLLYEATGSSTYYDEASNILSYERNNLWNPSTGQVYDGLTSQTPTTYNQGTFIKANDDLGWTGGATLACNYLMTMGSTNASPSSSGFHLMPIYGLDNNNSGLNGIGIRWASAYMIHRGMQSTYEAWLQANASCAWEVSRASDGLSWENWHLVCTNGAYVGSWDCVSSVAAVMDVPPTQ